MFFLILFSFVCSGLFFCKYSQRKKSKFSVVFHTYFHITGKMAGTRLNDPLLIRDEDDLLNCDEMCLHIDSDTSVEVATKRAFVVGNKFILSNLKELAHSFGLKWNCCTFRFGFTIKCNRASRKSKYLHQGLRSTTSITCGCEWSIRFMSVIKSHDNITDYIVITSVSPMHSNTWDHVYSDQLVLYRTIFINTGNIHVYI